jgi:hypothetical protein|nr:hypothetical protein [uncultured Psychroserpens sp.]
MKFLTILLLVFCITGNPNNNSSVTLGKNFKVETTFSGNTSKNQSFHLIVAKNKEKENFEIIPVSNNDGSLKKLESIVFKTEPSIVSFHNTNETVSLIVSSEENRKDKFTIVDVNLASGVSKTLETFSGEDFKTVIRKDHKNTLIFSNKDTLKIIVVDGMNPLKTINVETTDDDEVFLKDLNISSLDAVNTDEFVANGSIEEFRAYGEGDDVFITRENKRTSHTTISRISLEDDISSYIESTVFKSQSGEKTKKSTSFFNGKNLFKLQLDKKEGNVSVYDLDATKSSNLDLSSVKISKNSKQFDGIDHFLKKASKYANEPTISVNKTKSGDLAMRVDYVNKETYQYQYNWWWWHHWMWQNQMFHNQMMQQHINNSVPKGFGPAQPNFDFYYSKTESHFFEIVINTNNENVKIDNVETVHKFIDKKKYIDKLDEDTNVKHASTVFLDDELRYFGYDKKTKSFKVISEGLDD